jgi:hypothetical protein
VQKLLSFGTAKMLMSIILLSVITLRDRFKTIFIFLLKKRQIRGKFEKDDDVKLNSTTWLDRGTL